MALLVLLVVLDRVSGGGGGGSGDAAAEPAAVSSTSAVASTDAEPTTTVGPTSTTSSVPDSTTTTTLVGSGVEAPPQDEDNPAVVPFPIPDDDPPPPPSAPPPEWAESTFTTSAGHVSTDVGCVDDLDAPALHGFFGNRVGPVLGWDYQHVVRLGGDRYLWLFQDVFIDHSGTADDLGRSGFAHNAAMVQDGTCFRLLHGGSSSRPEPFETGTGSRTRSTWFWPMGGEVHGGRLYVFWAQMVKDPIDPAPPDGLGWHPSETWIATYDPDTLERLDFRRAPNSGATPIYGYAVQSDGSFTYLFGNTFEQNLAREGGYFNGPHSGTKMFLARVPRGQVFDDPEYRTADGWSENPAESEPILERHWAEFPMQPRLIDGVWVAVAAIDGYWGDAYSFDVADDPWGPWTTVEDRPIGPRNDDPKMNTYHAHAMPWRDANGDVVVSMSNNARNMFRDAWPNPWRYRPMVFTSPWTLPPADAPTDSPDATNPPSPTTTSSTTTTTTTLAPTTPPPTTPPPTPPPPTPPPPTPPPPTNPPTSPPTTPAPTTTTTLPPTSTISSTISTTTTSTTSTTTTTSTSTSTTTTTSTPAPP